MKNQEKIPASGFRVLEILKVLTQKPMTANEMLQFVEEMNDTSYRKELILKYLNTLKAFGFEIVKVKDKYYLENGMNKIDLNEEDLSMLLFMEKYTEKLKHEKLKNNLSSAIHTIEKSFSASTKKLIKENKINAYQNETEIVVKDKEIKKFEQYCLERQQLEIRYKPNNNSEESFYKIAPVNIIYKKCTAILTGYDYETNSYKEFLIQNITDSKQLPLVSKGNMPSIVTYKIKNRLAASYTLKENETLLEKGENYAIISNKNEDRDVLIKRLLRYYNECEILYPKECRTKIVNLIEEMEHMYV